MFGLFEKRLDIVVVIDGRRKVGLEVREKDEEGVDVPEDANHIENDASDCAVDGGENVDGSGEGEEDGHMQQQGQYGIDGLGETKCLHAS